MNDTWYNLTIPRHLNEKQKAYFWNHAQDHRLCGKNHRAGGPFDRSSPLSTSPTLRRANRIGTILYPLAIEPPLSQEQVTAVQNRKHVLAPPKDIAEVKNAYEIYKRPDELDPYSVDSFLTALGIMTQSMVDCEGNVSYFGILPQYGPYLVMELLD